MPYSVLIVDDEMLIREGLRRHLDWATLDMEVIGVADGAESALEIARRRAPDILITDICMRSKTGFDLILVGFRENIVFRSPQHQNIPMDISDKSSAVELQKPIHQIFPGDHRHLPYVFQCRSPERFRFIPHSCPLL